MEAEKLVRKSTGNKAQEQQKGKKKSCWQNLQLTQSQYQTDTLSNRLARSWQVGNISPPAQKDYSLLNASMTPDRHLPNLCLGEHSSLQCSPLFLLKLKKSVGQMASPPPTGIIPLQVKYPLDTRLYFF